MARAIAIRLLKPWQQVRSNPVMIKELRGRMRGRRTFVALTVYTVLLSLFALGIFFLYVRTSEFNNGPQGSLVGKVIFGGVAIIELMLISFTTPALTASAISGERERQTFDLLRTTLLPARSLLLGKLLAALSYVCLLIVAGLPLQSLAFFLGGVEPEEVILSAVLMFVTGLAFSTVGLFFSTLVRTSQASTVLSYGFALAMTIGLPIVFTILGPFVGMAFSYGNSPSWQTQVALVYIGLVVVSTNPVAAAVATEIMLLDNQSIWIYKNTITQGHTAWLVSPWLIFTFLYVLLTLILLKWSERRLRKAEN